MNRLISLAFLCSCLLMTSCTRNVSTLFGTIPSIYEGKIFEVAKKAHELNMKNGIGAGTDIIKAEAPLAFDAANAESLPQANKMVGKSVALEIDTVLHYELSGKAVITDVSLPEFTLQHSEPLKVTVDFDLVNCTDVARLYYYLCGENDTIHAGIIDVLPVQEGKLHVSHVFEAPNVPAEYQEKATMIRIVSERTYGYTKLNIDADQKLWRQEYNERLNGKKSALPVQ